MIRSRRAVWVLAGVLLAAAVARTQAGDERAGLVPAIALSDEAGGTFRLTDFAGKVVIVDFWASWCVPCKSSFPALDALHKELQPRGLEVVAVNVDAQRRAADAFLKTRPHDMRVAFDPRGVAAKAFDIKGMPSSVIIDRTGAIRFAHLGYTEKTLDLLRQEVQQLLGES